MTEDKLSKQKALAEQNDIAEQVVTTKKKRGSKSASVEATTTATKAEISTMLGDVLQWYDRPIVKTDEECAERLNEYFETVQKTGAIPTVEKMCLALGTTRRTVWGWQNGDGCSVTRSHMIKKAKEVLAAMDAELVSRGKIPQVTYIFRAKNFFDMKDQQDVIITPSNPLGDSADGDVLQKRITEGVIIEGETVE